MTEERDENKGFVVDFDKASQIADSLVNIGFTQAEDVLPPIGPHRTRVYRDGEGNEIIIAPHLPTGTGKKIVIVSPGAAPLIRDLLE